MLKNRESSPMENKEQATLKVVHKNSDQFQVYFPFSDVPVEMSKQYFEKNIRNDQFKINFIEELDHPKAG